MKSVVNRLIASATTMVALALMIVCVPQAVHAQAAAMKIQIPFQFHVGVTRFPAGTYVVQKSGEAIKVSNHESHTVMILSTAVWNPSAKMANQLTFNRYGDDYFLSEVRWSQYSEARSLIKSETEIQLARTQPATRVATVLTNTT